MQKIVNAAPTAGEGARLRRCLSAMVTAGIAAGYLTNPRLREVHWQAAGRPRPAQQVTVAGESAQFVDPAEIPADDDVAGLGQALAAGRRGDLHELMANTAAYSGLRQGELFALTTAQVAPAARVITWTARSSRSPGTLFIEAPKGRKRRKTIYPVRTPHGYPLAERLAARIEAARAEQARRHQPARADLPLPARQLVAVLQLRPPRPGSPPTRRPDGATRHGDGPWTWHSLRHVFCTTALFTWKLDATDVSCMAGHANVRTTLDMYIGTTAGVLDRARTATR